MRLWTIWRFRGVSIPQEVIAARASEPMEFSHEYQTVLGRVWAWTAREALEKFN